MEKEVTFTNTMVLFYKEIIVDIVRRKTTIVLNEIDLTKDNVRQALAQKQVDNAIIDAYLDIVAQCEYARFAPGDPNATMDRIFTEATEAINKLDTILK